MKSIAPKSTSVARLAALWGVAAAVVLAAEIAARLSPAPTWERDEEQLLTWQVDKIGRLEPGAVVLLGDSSLGSDVDAALLAELLGRPVANLALVASFTTFGDAFLLERLIEEGRTPSAVVLFHTADTWPRPFAEDFYQLAQRGTGRVGLETWSRDLAASSALVRQSNAWKVRLFETGRGLVWRPGAIDDDVAKSAATRAGLPEHDFVPPGTMDWPMLEARVDAGHPPGLFRRGDPRFHVDPHVELWFDRTLDLAAEHGVPVFVATSPTWEARCLYPPNRTYLRDLAAWLEQRSENGTRYRLLWKPALAVESRWLGDSPNHLSVEAKRGPFTIWFARQLERALAGEPSTLPAVELWDPFRGRAVGP